MRYGILALIFGGAIVWALFAMAQEPEKNDYPPTVIFGAAATATGGQNEFVVEQPDGAPNPLGDPIDVSDTPPQVADIPEEMSNRSVRQNADDAVSQQAAQSQGNLPAESQALGKDFQNTLLEANGRVYDVQSYPEQDFNLIGNPANPQTIYSPNVNN